MDWRLACQAAVASAGLGLLLWLLGGGEGGFLGRWSYDLLTVSQPQRHAHDAVIIYMDERSLRDLGQRPEDWDRALHAQLLEHLTREQARLVVFDLWFGSPGHTVTNALLAQAMKANGNVVLVAPIKVESGAGFLRSSVQLPVTGFLEAARGWGVGAVLEDRRQTVREIYTGDEQKPGISWQAAVLAGATLPALTHEPARNFWLRYYGPPGTIPSVSYSVATNAPPGYYRDKIVFIGGSLNSFFLGDAPDKFRTPYTRGESGKAPGVELLATGTLNLIHGDWLRRGPGAAEALGVLVIGCVFGWSAGRVRRWELLAMWTAGGAFVVFLFFGWLAMTQYVWFPWLIPIAVQLPAAVLVTWRKQWTRTQADRQTQVMAALLKQQPLAADGLIPDHTLLRRVGQGGYGEIWLARNEVGILHAVKIVYRKNFAGDNPYEREFRGIQKFMPVSRTHPGFVHILHVGRNREAGFYFYIMEVGDAQNGVTPMVPETYEPRTLASDLAQRGRLPLADCLELGLVLADALEHLHQKQLVHRDIKPSNIIYVEGAPKFADIGLVTQLAGQGEEVSRLGTEGYMPPEGPGSASADVYSLGKVIYEASMGRDRRAFPELPTDVLESEPDAAMDGLTNVLLKACDTEAARRYASAAAFRADLLRLKEVVLRGGKQ